MAPKPDGTPAASSSSDSSITSGGVAVAVARRRVAASIPRPERRRSEHTAARDASSASLPSRREASSQLRRIGEEVAARSWMAACEAGEARRGERPLKSTRPSRAVSFIRALNAEPAAGTNRLSSSSTSPLPGPPAASRAHAERREREEVNPSKWRTRARAFRATTTSYTREKKKHPCRAAPPVKGDAGKCADY